MVVVVPREADLTMGSSVGDATEPFGAVGPVLQGLEVGLAEGVVIAGVGSAVGLDDPQVGEQAGHLLGLPAGPRTACRVSWPGRRPGLAQVARMTGVARAADLPVATIQPTPSRLKTSMITSR